MQHSDAEESPVNDATRSAAVQTFPSAVEHYSDPQQSRGVKADTAYTQADNSKVRITIQAERNPFRDQGGGRSS